MVLSDEDIQSFQDLYRSSFGKEISRADAYESAVQLLRLTSLVYKPMTQTEYDFIQKRRKETAL